VRDALTPIEALLLTLATFLAMATVGGVVPSGPFGIVVAEMLGVLLPTVAWCQARGVSLAQLGYQPSGWRAEVGGVLVGLGAFWVTALLEDALERVWPTPPQVKESLRRLIVSAEGRPLAIDLLALALVPAVCEETLFRGAVLGALRRYGAAASVVGSAGLFALYHVQPHRMLPVALMGLLIGWVRLRSGSLLPAIAVHTANNCAVVLLVQRELETVPSPRTPIGALGAAGAAVSLGVGVLLLQRTQPR
jgi:sodium transport system permease protein